MRISDRCRSIPHSSSRPGIDFMIVRENTEGLYSGIERLEDNGNRAITERVITRRGSERIVRKAFELAHQTGRKTVHVIHKANVLRQSDGLFRSVAIEVAEDYPEITLMEMLVDTCAMELVRAPEQFEVIVTTNLFGDILSDEACMFVGGLGRRGFGKYWCGRGGVRAGSRQRAEFGRHWKSESYCDNSRLGYDVGLSRRIESCEFSSASRLRLALNRESPHQTWAAN